MKKICFVTTVYVTFRCFLKKYVDFLQKTGEYDISLICNPEDGLQEDLPNYVHYFPVIMKRGISVSGFSALREMEKIFKRERFDIVQYSTPNAALYASLAATKARIPVRLYCQWGIRYMGFEGGLSRCIFKYLEALTCRKSTFVEAESHNIRNFALEEKLYLPEKSCVIWNGSASGVDLQKFNLSKREEWRQEIRARYSVPEDAVVFAFAGRLTADKGINELLEAFLNISRDHSEARLFIMGGMDNQGSLNPQLYQEAKQNSACILTGNVDDIEKYYAASDVFVAPSYREGFGLVVIEAEAMGLPAIVSDVPGQIDAILPDKSGLLCHVRNAASLEEKMAEMLQFPEKRKQMAGCAVSFAKDNFEQEKLFSYLEEKLRELMGEKARA